MTLDRFWHLLVCCNAVSFTVWAARTENRWERLLWFTVATIFLVSATS